MSKTVKEIVTCWLKDNGYDGLFNDYGCGCHLSDFAPCDEMSQGCEAAYKFECSRCELFETCEKSYGEDGKENWLMSPYKDFCTPQYRKQEDE